MPLYDYVCRDCGHRMEVMHSVTANGPEACPACGGAMRKVIVAAAVHYKGSGWAKVERRTSAASPRTATGETGSGKSDSGQHGGEAAGGGSNASSTDSGSAEGSSSSGAAASAGSGGETSTAKASSGSSGS